MNARLKAITDPSKLTGPERAAVVLLALGEEHKTIWQHLDEEEIKEISQAMAGLGTVSSSAVEQLLVDFISGMSGAGAIMGHPVDTAGRSSGIGGATLYHGVASTFVRAGFVEVGRTAANRPVMRLQLR